MAGSQYIALSGMRSRLDELDRLSADIANAGTAGYKTERTTDAQADRPRFDAVLQTAIDVTPGGRRLDVTPGAINGTGRDLDLAIEGPGFFVVETPGGTRYTRNGHFARTTEGTLTRFLQSPRSVRIAVDWSRLTWLNTILAAILVFLATLVGNMLFLDNSVIAAAVATFVFVALYVCVRINGTSSNR